MSQIPLTEQAIHPMRWRLITIWIVAFTALVMWAIVDNKSQTNDLQRTKASIGNLQTTNCTLKKFLLTARNARLDAAKTSKTRFEHDTNIKAATGYDELLIAFKNIENCHIPAKLTRPVSKENK